MKSETIENIGAGLVVTYLLGVPVMGGYILAATQHDPRAAFAVIFGAFFWPVVLLGKIGVWLAS